MEERRQGATGRHDWHLGAYAYQINDEVVVWQSAASQRKGEAKDKKEVEEREQMWAFSRYATDSWESVSNTCATTTIFAKSIQGKFKPEVLRSATLWLSQSDYMADCGHNAEPQEEDA